MNHPTKTKADLAVGKIIVDLLEKDYLPYISFTEHQPFDLLAVSTGNFSKILKIQCKYIQLDLDGTIKLYRSSSWSRYNGEVVHKNYQESDFDYFGVYCPEVKEILYVPNFCGQFSSLSIRVTPSKNNQIKGVKYYKEFLEIPSW